MPDSNTRLAGGQDLVDWTGVFSLYRVESVPGGQVITGRLAAGLTPETSTVRDLLARWRGSHGTRLGTYGWELVLFQPRERRERWWLHVVLFLLTWFSTVVAGSLLAGYNPLEISPVLFRDWWIPVPIGLDPRNLARGLPFGTALVAVLAFHEAGHYFAARHHRISVTPPFFIPFPPYVSIIGTLGAFIRLRSPVLDRRTLLDVGVAGPFLSFAVSLPLIWWGLLHSHLEHWDTAVPTGYLIHFAGEHFWLGGSLIFSGFARIIFDFSSPGQALALHPLAFAGWLGLFVTALNLLPITQLDGGHILYALLGRHQKLLAQLFFIALLPLGFLWAGWWVWAALVFLIGRGRLQHPPLFNSEEGLDRRRLLLGVAAALVFALCFIPVPFRL